VELKISDVHRDSMT